MTCYCEFLHVLAHAILLAVVTLGGITWAFWNLSAYFKVRNLLIWVTGWLLLLSLRKRKQCKSFILSLANMDPSLWYAHSKRASALITLKQVSEELKLFRSALTSALFSAAATYNLTWLSLVINHHTWKYLSLGKYWCLFPAQPHAKPSLDWSVQFLKKPWYYINWLGGSSRP